MSQEFMVVRYNWPAFGAAWLLAVYTLYLQGLVVRRVKASDRDTGFGWWLGGGLCTGTGVWASTFLGQVALQWPIKVGYMPAVVLASWLPAVAISFAAIWMYAQQGFAIRYRILGGLLVAFGFCLLVFVNVSSMAMKPGVVWSLRGVAGAVLLTLVGCMLASILVRLDLKRAPAFARALGVAVVVATAIRVGQVAMGAAFSLPAGAVCLSADQLSGEAMVLVLTATVLLLFVVVQMATLLDARAQGQKEKLVQSLQQAQSALEVAAQQDVATGLLNRLGFEHHLRQILSGQATTVQGLTVMRANLDGFRAFVDTYGHTLGDTLLRHLALRLRGLVRGTDLLARGDGDEFLLLCPDLADSHLVAQLAQRLGESVREPCLIQDVDISLTCSVGIAQYPGSANAEQLMSHSNDAMLTARKAGGAVYCFFERGMDRTGADQVEMQRDLRHAIERGELSIHFQPKLVAATGALAGVEALLRWTHPQRGSVSPGQFIPVAERFGLIGELGLWVLQEACRYVRRWHDAGLDIPVAVNLSAHQLRQPDLERQVREALQRHQVPARMLILEITESVAMDDIESSMRVFDMLADIGVQLSIDDFGTGYSSLSYLRRLPARQVKIDRSFVKDLDHSHDAQAIVEAVVRLSHALGLKVVAEGVETPAQAGILTDLACDELQGFLFAKPMPEAALLGWVAQRDTTVPRPQDAAAASQPVPAEAPSTVATAPALGGALSIAW